MLKNVVREKVLYIITFLVKFFLSVAGYLRRSNETRTSLEICNGLVDVLL